MIQKSERESCVPENKQNIERRENIISNEKMLNC